jgi:hypothetical protein
MSGIFARPHFDNCYTDEFINQQTNPGNYRLFNLYGENVNKCYSEFGPSTNMKRSTGEIPTGDISKRVEFEGYLLNLDVPNSKCIDINTMKAKNKRLNDIFLKESYTRPLCDDKLNYNYSRNEISTNEFRSVYINRFNFPIVEPQDNIYYGINGTDQIGSNRSGVNTKLQLKDSIRK